MGNLTLHAEGIPTCSFKSSAKVPIDSLKIHFLPQQVGSGDPSPSNVRQISGWTGLNVNKTRKNLLHIVGYSASSIDSPTSYKYKTGSYGNTISTTSPKSSVTTTQSQWPSTTDVWSYRNGYFKVEVDNLIFNQYYDISFKISNITNNPLNVTLSQIKIGNPYGNYYSGANIINNDTVLFKNYYFRQNNAYPNRSEIDIYYCGLSATFSEFMVTPANTSDGIYEPYCGQIIPVTFPPVGKNLLDPNNYYFAGTGVLAFGGNASSSIPDGSIYLKAGTYTFSCNVTCNALGGTESTGVMLGTAANATSFTFTLNSDNTVRFFIVKNNATEEDFQSYHYQLEKNSTATTYEPYNTTVYGGYIDIAKGELVQTHKKVVLNDSTKWTRTATTGSWFVRFYDVPMEDRKTGSSLSLICNIAPAYSQNITYYTQFNKKSDYYFTLWWDTAQVTPTPVEDIQTLSANNAIEICYPLATPITYSLSPLELQTFLNQNSIWSNASDKVECDYELHETRAIMSAKKRIAANEPHLETTTPAVIASFNTDMIAPLKECKVNFLPVQRGSGDPSPTNVRPISGWTGSIAYKTGKNILNTIDSTPTANSYNISDGMVTLSTVGSGNGSRQWFNQVFPAGTYTISAKYSGAVSGVRFLCDKAIDYWTWNNYYNGYFSPTNNTVTFTTSEDFSIGIIFLTLSGHVGELGSIYNLQLELGSTATSYEPYNGTTIPIAFPATTNLFNEQWEQGNIEVGNDAGSSTSMRTNFINVNPSTSYYLYTSRENNVFVFEYLEDGTYANKVNSVYTSHTFTTGSTTKKIRIVDRNSGTETVNTGINYPATITYYEPYGTIYGGYIDLIKGELVQTHGCIFNSTKALNFTELNDGFWYTTSSGLQVPAIKGLNAGLITNRLKAIDSVSGNSPDGTIAWYANGIIRWREHRDLSLTDYQAYLAENPLQLVYELATPITYQLTPQQLKTLRGTNNIWSNSNDNTEVTYWTH